MLGLFVSTIGGAIVLWILIDKIGWRYIQPKYYLTVPPRKPKKSLTMWLGIVERASYTLALIMGLPQWIAVWLALKVAVGWSVHQRREAPNLYLIGCVISIIFGVMGAWIANPQLIPDVVDALVCDVVSSIKN